MYLDPDPDPDPESPVLPLPAESPPTGCDLVELVLAAKKGNMTAWNSLIRRYTPLVGSITRRYRLSLNDAEDVSQLVWLRLFENLTRLREPRALPGWIRTTTKNEALRLLASGRRVEPVDPSVLVAQAIGGVEEGTGADGDLLRVERDRAILNGLAELTPDHRNLLILLHAEPRASYREISRTLGMPPGSIGPTRARCLNKLRNTRAVQTFLRSEGDPEYPMAA
jgi:RNA polymerase sigma factor (sigma-70 family)